MVVMMLVLPDIRTCPDLITVWNRGGDADAGKKKAAD
jgi:hypothetical protein